MEESDFSSTEDLSTKQYIALGIAVTWCIAVATGYSLRLYDWIGALLFEAPLIFGARFLWTSIELGKDGFKLTNFAAKVVSKAALAIQVQRETPDDLAIKTLSASTQSVPHDPPSVDGMPEIDQMQERSWNASSIADFKVLPNFRVSLNRATKRRNSVIRFERLAKDLGVILDSMFHLSGMREIQAASPAAYASSLRTVFLLQPDVYQSLLEVLLLANNVIYASRQPTTDKSLTLSALGSSLVEQLQALSEDPVWLRQALVVRAKLRNQQVEFNSHSNATNDTLIVNGEPIAVVQTLMQPIPGNVMVASRPPVESERIRLVNSGSPVAWPQAGRFTGSPEASRKAGWLFTAI